MDSTLTVLVIILSVGFIILLTLSITVIYVLIRILQNIRGITKKTELATENMSETMRMIVRKVAPLALPTIGGALLRRLIGKKR
ncbi:MAG TPA: hypothetical protein VK963_00535 [Candidatus Saccharimonadales bacterium]|nr:hypothetical protein [Candidatus Saccharimonadales bacterium]